MVSRMAPSSSALAWPTARRRGGARRRGRGDGASASARTNQRQRGIHRPMKSCNRRASVATTPHVRRSLARGDRHRRAGVRCAAAPRRRARHRARRDRRLLPAPEGSESPSDRESGVGIEQPVEPVDQDAHRKQIEQRPVAAGFAVRRAAPRAQAMRGCVMAGSGASDAVGGSTTRRQPSRLFQAAAVRGRVAEPSR